MRTSTRLMTRLTLPCVLVALFTTLFVHVGGAQAASSQACGKWQIIKHPDPIAVFTFLKSVTALSSNDVWAIGYDYWLGNGPVFTLTDHWNGSQWSIVNSPNPSSVDNFLQASAAAATNDVWAVGYTDQGNQNVSKTLIEHWNGSAWSVVPSPNADTGLNYLQGVTAVALNDAWAVGYSTSSSSRVEHTLVEHWNGSTWNIVNAPSPGALYSGLESVTTVATNDIWAVGNYNQSINAPLQTLVEHWNGTTWSTVASPNPPSSDANLISAAAIATNDVWAVGLSSNLNGNGRSKTLIEHWNGTTWSIVASPNTASSNGLSSVAAVSTNNVWAVGDEAFNGGTNYKTVIEHWNGTQWSLTKSANTKLNVNVLSGVGATANGNVWAVGSYNDFTGPSIHSLIEAYC